MRASSKLRVLFASLLGAGVLFGCAGPAKTSAPAAPSVTPATRTPAAPRTVATDPGDGVDVIDPGDGGRTLSVRGTVLRRTPRDPMVDLLFRFVPAPRRVLILGVGTGQLSSELAKRGVDVVVLESKPALAGIVCDHMGCGGKVVIDPAPWHVVGGYQSNPELPELGPAAASASIAYDAVLVDEEITQYPGSFTASSLDGVPLSEGALLARRTRGDKASPTSMADDSPPPLLSTERADGTFDGIELVSGTPAAFDGAGLTAWPMQQTIDVAPGQSGEQKAIRAFGYLAKRPDGAIVLELPHDRAGAVVVRLHGEVADRELAPRAAPGALFRGSETHEHADASMVPLLGPGHSRREWRSVVGSGVAVAVKGRARFAGRADDPRHSGPAMIYDLDVTSVERVLDRTTWGPAEAKHVARLDAARAKVASGDYVAAADELEAAARELRAFLGPDADHCLWVHATENFAVALRELDKSGLLSSCSLVTQFSPTRPERARLVPHPADVALYGALKKRIDGELLRRARRAKDDESRQAAACWWRSTFYDSTRLTPTQLEIARRFPSVARAVD